MNWIAYDKSNLRGDLFGGITAGIVSLPLALAFGVQSGMGAIAGLYGAIGLKSPSTIIGVFQGLPTALTNLNLDTLILTGATIAIIYTFPKITKKRPLFPKKK
jgi:MFS superfamily sulfate permease-like transporter